MGAKVEADGVDISACLTEIDLERVELLKDQRRVYLWSPGAKTASFTLAIEAFPSPTPCWSCGGRKAVLGDFNAEGDYVTVCADCGACTAHPPDTPEPTCP